MMKRLLFISAIFLPMFVMAQTTKKVAVYVMGEDAGINKVFGSELVSAIARSEEYTAVERTSAFLAELGKEQNYQRTGNVDDSELSRLGKHFGVQYICVAAVTNAFNEKYLSARLIDVESAQVESSASSSKAIQSLPDVVDAANSVSHELISYLGSSIYSNVKKVAIYIVRNDAAKDIGRVLGDKLVAGFTKSGRYVAIERTNSFLNQLNKEQKYQRTGAVDDSDISRLGKQSGVQYVCIAEVSDIFGEKYISTRLIDVETAKIVNTSNVGGSINDMKTCIQKADEIALNLSKKTSEEQLAEQAEDDAFAGNEEVRIGDKVYHVGDKMNLAGDEVYDVVEQPPYFPPCTYEITKEKVKKTLKGTKIEYYKETVNNPGGAEGLILYLSENVRYPADAEENGIQGRVVCSFVVERDGSITDVQVARSVDQSLDKEAVRLIRSMPKWIPGSQNGSHVRVKYTVPVTFRLQ